MNAAIARVQKDLVECHSYMNPDNPPIFVKPRHDNVDTVDCLVVGPPDTPYEFGFFQFGIIFFKFSYLHL
jgi:ubiquitin-protein ligase